MLRSSLFFCGRWRDSVCMPVVVGLMWALSRCGTPFLYIHCCDAMPFQRDSVQNVWVIAMDSAIPMMTVSNMVRFKKKECRSPPVYLSFIAVNWENMLLFVRLLVMRVRVRCSVSDCPLFVFVLVRSVKCVNVHRDLSFLLFDDIVFSVIFHSETQTVYILSFEFPSVRSLSMSVCECSLSAFYCFFLFLAGDILSFSTRTFVDVIW